MTAALDLDQGLEHASGPWPFQVPPDLIEICGGHFAPEQIEMYERAHGTTPRGTQFALAVSTVADPRRPHGIPGHALMALAHGDYEIPVLLPRVVILDWDYWPRLDVLDPAWRRFPSLPARELYEDDGWQINAIDGYRLWDLWPLGDRDEAVLVLDAARAYYNDELLPLIAYLTFDTDPTGVCAQVGTPEATHRHEFNPDGTLAFCSDSWSWLRMYEQHHIALDLDGEFQPVPLPPVRGLRHLDPVWQNLLTTSRINTQAGLACFPDAERDHIRLTERFYSPWSWLS